MSGCHYLGGYLGIGSALPTQSYWLNMPPGSTTTGAMCIQRANDPPTTLQCGQLFYTGQLGMDLCGGLRSYATMCIFNQTATQTVADSPPNSELSLFDGGVGSRTLPAHTLKQGVVIRIKNRTLLSCRQNKDATMNVYVGANSITSTVTYGANLTNSYAEIELDLVAVNIDPGTGVGDIMVMGRTLYGTGPTGSAVNMRFLTGTIAGVNTFVPNTVDITFQWSDLNGDARNTLTTYINTLHIFD